MEKVKVFFIPYSGASSMIYSSWKEYLADNIIFAPIEFPARGQRYMDSLCSTVDELIEDLYKQIENELDDIPFAFFGHCIGGVLAYELALKIRKEKNLEPVHLFVSGRQVPHIDYHKKLSTMSEEEFFDEVMNIEENLKTIFTEKVLREIYVPIFKADLLMSETYNHIYNDYTSKLNCNISILVGDQDNFVNEIDIIEWPKYTTKDCKYHIFEGGHLYLHNYASHITEIINDSINLAAMVGRKV